MSGDDPTTPSPSSSRQPESSRPSLRPPSSVSEWQLLAVLHRANLLQYYDIFIAQGGDDVNQIMQCDEHEFMEIMSLVGMISKPLHVRRLQRTLTEFSKDQASFNIAAIQHIGPPPVSQFASIGGTDPIQLFMPNMNLTSSSPSLVLPANSSSPADSTLLSSIGATANVLTGDYLQSLVDKNQSSPSPQDGGDFVALGDFDPNGDNTTGENPVLTEAQISRLAHCSQLMVHRLPPYKPKLIQNKKKISKELLDILAMPHTNPRRPDEYRRYSAIYGRFDAKRKPDKALTLHEVSVNEAAAQICMLVPALLTRRDELFSLARQVVKDAGYHYVKTRKDDSRKRCSNEAFDAQSPSSPHSPRSSYSTSPTPGPTEEEEKPDSAKRSFLEQWADTLNKE